MEVSINKFNHYPWLGGQYFSVCCHKIAAQVQSLEKVQGTPCRRNHIRLACLNGCCRCAITGLWGKGGHGLGLVKYSRRASLTPLCGKSELRGDPLGTRGSSFDVHPHSTDLVGDHWNCRPPFLGEAGRQGRAAVPWPIEPSGPVWGGKLWGGGWGCCCRTGVMVYARCVGRVDFVCLCETHPPPPLS